MNDAHLYTLTERLDRFERGNRWWKRAFVVLLVVLISSAWIRHGAPAQVAKVLEAERFILRDTSGRLRAELGLLKGAPTLSLLDQGEARLVSLTLTAENAGMLVLNADRGGHVMLAAKPDGSALLSFLDQQRKIRVGLVGAPDGSASLTFVDMAKTLRAELLIDENGAPLLNFFDRSGKVVWSAP